jgi:hypothetical protein
MVYFKHTYMKNLLSRIQYFLVLTIFSVPVLAHAVTTTTGSGTRTKNLKDLIGLAIEYFNYGIAVIIGLATLTFIWNVYNLYFKADADRQEAGKYVLYSVIGFFVMLSLWGLVNLLTNSFRLDTNRPSFPFSSSGSNTSSDSQDYFQNQGNTSASGFQNQGNTSASGFQNQGNSGANIGATTGEPPINGDPSNQIPGINP